MSSIPYIGDQVAAGRETIDRSMDQIRKQIDAVSVSRGQIVAAGVMIGAVAAGLGLIVYRRRRRRQSLAQRLQSALADSMSAAALRAQLKRPLKRAVRAL